MVFFFLVKINEKNRFLSLQGDFAVLLKAGMSARQAVYYNVLSSVLSFFGTILGIMIGDTPEASSWIFACAAGTFIYIALVDMVSFDCFSFVVTRST